jgi:hypothetical protein
LHIQFRYRIACLQSLRSLWMRRDTQLFTLLPRRSSIKGRRDIVCLTSFKMMGHCFLDVLSRKKRLISLVKKLNAIFLEKHDDLLFNMLFFECLKDFLA